MNYMIESTQLTFEQKGYRIRVVNRAMTYSAVSLPKSYRVIIASSG